MDIKDFKLGAIESNIDLRDYDYSMIASVTGEEVSIPTSFKLDYKYPILDQGNVGSCVAHALSEMKSYIDCVAVNNMYSIGFIYADRKDDDFKGSGLVTRESLKNLVTDGNCYKKDFPLNKEYPDILTDLDKYGKDNLFNLAKDHKALAYVKLEASEIKKYLVTQQKPVLLCIKVYQNLYTSMLNGGKIPTVPTGDYKGNHALICIGYDKDTLILVNSWNEKNGDNGIFYLDVNSSIISECWGLEDKKNIILPPTNPEAKYDIGWNKSKYNGKWFYSTDGNNCYTDCWQQIKNIWYCFDEEGYAVENNWTLYNKGKWYFLEQNSCAMATDKWILWNDKWYRVNSNGEMLIGWYQDSNNKWYYLDIDKGYCYTDCKILIDGKYYSFDSSGAWIENSNILSDKGADFIGSWEGFWAKAGYDPCYPGVEKYITIGYGTTKEARPDAFPSGIDSTCTVEQARQWLIEEGQDKAETIKNDLDSRGITLQQHELDALISFAYNCGVGQKGLFGSTLYKNVISGVRNTDTITSNFVAWNKANGKEEPGLTRRRQGEAALFLNADYTGNI